MLYPYRKKRPPTLTFRVATTFHDPRVINTEYPSTGPCHIGRFKKIDNVMSARPWDSVKAFAVTSIEACLSAKNEVTVERIKIHYSKKWKVRIGGIFTLWQHGISMVVLYFICCHLCLPSVKYTPDAKRLPMTHTSANATNYLFFLKPA